MSTPSASQTWKSVLEGPRVSCVVLARTKLQRVDEDADHNYIAERLGQLDEGAMSLMQGAHRGHIGNTRE